MKRFILVVAVLLMTAQAYAQLVPGAGYINSTLNTKYGGNSIEKEVSGGFYAGASYNLIFDDDDTGLGIAPGLYFSMLSARNVESRDFPYLKALTGSVNFREMALNVPVDVTYSFELADGAKIFAYAGPTFQLGLSSKYSSDGLLSLNGIFKCFHRV